MKKTKEENTKKPNNGFGLRMTMAVFLYIITVLYLVWDLMAAGYGEFSLEFFLEFLTPAIILLIFAVLQTVFAVAGKKHLRANTGSIVLGALFCCALFGIFGIVGGVRGRKSLKLREVRNGVTGEAVYEQPSKTTSESPSSVTDSKKNWRDNYPLDYENKPTVSQVLDFGNTDNLVMTNDDGVIMEFAQLYVTSRGGMPYVLCETVGLAAEDGGGLLVFCIDYANDKLLVEKDNSVYNAVFEEYNSALDEAQEAEKQKIKRSEFKLDLYDTNVDERTWKDFKKTATQDELTVIAIGAKYRVAHSRIKNIIYAIGIVLSIALFWPTGGYSLIGYPIFAFLATKAIRYQDTFYQAYRKLSKENRAFVDGYYNSNIWLAILDGIIKFATIWITIPYQAILVLIGMFAPNFVISKNGILVSLPKGYDVGNLGAVGAYYSSFSFIDESMSALEKHAAENAKHQVTYRDEYGNETTVDDRAAPYTVDGAKVYKDKYGNEYLSDDGGKHIHKKDN